MHIFLAYMISVVVVIAAAMVVLNLQKPSIDIEIEDVKQGDTIWWYHKGKLYNAVVTFIHDNSDCYCYVEFNSNAPRCGCYEIIPMQDIVKIKRNTK